MYYSLLYVTYVKFFKSSLFGGTLNASPFVYCSESFMNLFPMKKENLIVGVDNGYYFIGKTIFFFLKKKEEHCIFKMKCFYASERDRQSSIEYG